MKSYPIVYWETMYLRDPEQRAFALWYKLGPQTRANFERLYGSVYNAALRIFAYGNVQD